MHQSEKFDDDDDDVNKQELVLWIYAYDDFNTAYGLWNEMFPHFVICFSFYEAWIILYVILFN